MRYDGEVVLRSLRDGGRVGAIRSEEGDRD